MQEQRQNQDQRLNNQLRLRMEKKKESISRVQDEDKKWSTQRYQDSIIDDVALLVANAATLDRSNNNTRSQPRPANG